MWSIHFRNLSERRKKELCKIEPQLSVSKGLCLRCLSSILDRNNWLLSTNNYIDFISEVMGISEKDKHDYKLLQ